MTDADIPRDDPTLPPIPNNFLGREQIDEILSLMTARDIFSAMPSTTGEEVQGAAVAGAAFESAAERQGHGSGALDRVRPTDAIYLAQALGEAFSIAGPKSDASADSPISAASTE
jgi:hypothetical protein